MLALGVSGAHNYGASLTYVENASGTPGTLANPRYKQTLTYNDAGNTLTGYDFDWTDEVLPAYDDNGNQIGNTGADVWFEGSAFMSLAYYLQGNASKADAINTEIIKKQGTSGASLGGYSLLAERVQQQLLGDGAAKLCFQHRLVNNVPAPV